MTLFLIEKRGEPAIMIEELTWQEERVYKLLVEEGLSLKEIGIKLGIRRSTVVTYLTKICQKLFVDNQKELIIKHYKQLLKDKEAIK